MEIAEQGQLRTMNHNARSIKGDAARNKSGQELNRTLISYAFWCIMMHLLCVPSDNAEYCSRV